MKKYDERKCTTKIGITPFSEIKEKEVEVDKLIKECNYGILCSDTKKAFKKMRTGK